jgi:hypothetical protein
VTAWRLGRRIEGKGEGIIYMLSKDQGRKGGTNRPDGISGRVQVKVERKDVQDTDRAAVVREKKIRNDQHQAGKEKYDENRNGKQSIQRAWKIVLDRWKAYPY